MSPPENPPTTLLPDPKPTSSPYKMNPWTTYLPPNRLKWTIGYSSCPIWPSEPEIPTITTIAASALNIDRDTITVSFLADGANHKVYDIIPKPTTTSTSPMAPSSSSSTPPITHLFRVAIPTHPIQRLESEIATLEYLRQHTTIPISKPIAWNSDANNELGYEWAIFEKIPGVQLSEVWRVMEWEKKVEVVEVLEVLAGYLAQLWRADGDGDVRFEKIGSLYFESFLDGIDQYGIAKPGDTVPPKSTMTKIDDVRNTGFKLGPSIDGLFFSGRRRYLTSNSGPFTSDAAWLNATIDIELEFVRSVKILFESRDGMPPEYKSLDWKSLQDEIEYYENDGFPDEYEQMVKTVGEFRELLPVLFPVKEVDAKSAAIGKQYVLYHNDLRDANIIVDPVTFKITGIIDWEGTHTAPEWYALNYPYLINAHAPYEDKRPPTPSPADWDDDDKFCSNVEYERWEEQDLRVIFDREMGKLGLGSGKDGDWRRRSERDRLKSKFKVGVHNTTDMITWALGKLRDIREGLQKVDGS